ncbi:MAG: hypothetical protein ACE5GB_10585, partial [Acidimicrobiales bacterium]
MTGSRDRLTRLLRPLSLAIGVALVVVVAVLGWRSIEPRPESVRWAPLVVLATVAALSFAVVATELRLIGRAVAVDITPPVAVTTTVLATAANMLPLPGAVLTRLVVLRRLGAPAGASVRALGVTGGLWLGVALVVAGFGMAPASGVLTLVLVPAGALTIGVAVVLLLRAGATGVVTATLVAVETTMI